MNNMLVEFRQKYLIYNYTDNFIRENLSKANFDRI